jgi:hypothetical protein
MEGMEWKVGKEIKYEKDKRRKTRVRNNDKAEITSHKIPMPSFWGKVCSSWICGK